MKTVKQFLSEEWNEQGGHIIKKALLTHSADLIGSYMNYADVEGSYMAVFSFWDHNVEDMMEVENDKWVGYELRVDDVKTDWLRRNTGKDTIKLIIPQWVMKIEAKSEFHAKNLFNKYLRRL